MPVTPVTATPNFMNSIIQFIQQNQLYIIIFGAGVFAVWYFFLKDRGSGGKIISRKQVERLTRIKELEGNGRNIAEKHILANGEEIWTDTNYNSIWHGSQYKGRIMNIVKHEIKGNPENKIFYEIIWRKPTKIFGIILPFPFGEKEIYILNEDTLIKHSAGKKLIIIPTVSIDSFSGYYYDNPHELDHRNFINEQINKHDMEGYASQVYVESQKNSVIPRDVGAAAMLKEKELEIEMAKKRGAADKM